MSRLRNEDRRVTIALGIIASSLAAKTLSLPPADDVLFNTVLGALFVSGALAAVYLLLSAACEVA
ncbi:MAG TPA: hypothetical protein VJP80_07930 [Candidatus Saccharimonadales bacterium]|nr:hypothetical protein [Candidatus Saccharimonadales bacterium]